MLSEAAVTKFIWAIAKCSLKPFLKCQRLKLTGLLRRHWYLILHVLLAVTVCQLSQDMSVQQPLLGTFVQEVHWPMLSRAEIENSATKIHQSHRAWFQGWWKAMQLIQRRQEYYCLHQVKLQFRHPDLNKGGECKCRCQLTQRLPGAWWERAELIA